MYEFRIQVASEQWHVIRSFDEIEELHFHLVQSHSQALEPFGVLHFPAKVLH
jgi:hypothetical protein